MAYCFSGGAPTNAGSDVSTLRQLINTVAAKGTTLPSVAARNATIRSADYATTGTRPFDVVTSIVGSYSTSSPYTGASASVAGTGGAVTSTLTAKSGSSGIAPCPVYGLYIRIVSSNQTALGSVGFAVNWQTADGQTMNNNILLDPAQPLQNGNVQAEAWVFPAYQILGRYVYTPANLGLIVQTATTVLTVRAAQEVSVVQGFNSSNYLPTNATMFITALTRGQREVDDVFSSFSATTQKSSALLRSM